jgi:hypothetical protein
MWKIIFWNIEPNRKATGYKLGADEEIWTTLPSVGPNISFSIQS